MTGWVFPTIRGGMVGISPTVVLAELLVCSLSHSSRGGWGDGARKRRRALGLLMLLRVLKLLLLLLLPLNRSIF